MTAKELLSDFQKQFSVLFKTGMESVCVFPKQKTKADLKR